MAARTFVKCSTQFRANEGERFSDVESEHLAVEKLLSLKLSNMHIRWAIQYFS